MNARIFAGFVNFSYSIPDLRTALNTTYSNNKYQGEIAAKSQICKIHIYMNQQIKRIFNGQLPWNHT